VVERIGDECRGNEFHISGVRWIREGADEKGLEYAKKKPQIVTRA